MIVQQKVMFLVLLTAAVAVLVVAAIFAFIQLCVAIYDVCRRKGKRRK